MKRIDELKLELAEIEKALKSKVIDQEIILLMQLIKQRGLIVEQIQSLIWSEKTREEKASIRQKDIDIMKLYEEKYGNEVSRKLERKINYINLIVALDNLLKNSNDQNKIIYLTLREILESEEYKKINYGGCFQTLMDAFLKYSYPTHNASDNEKQLVFLYNSILE